MRIDASEFLQSHPGCWIAQRRGEFPVINLHAAEIAAAPARVFDALADRSSLVPAWRWRALFALRDLLGKLFNWDAGLKWYGPEALIPGNHYAFFRIEHVTAPTDTSASLQPPGSFELGLSVENKLTHALMSYVVAPQGSGSRLFNVTCARFKGRTGRAYWRVIRPFHDALAEDMLAHFCRRAERRGNSVL